MQLIRSLAALAAAVVTVVGGAVAAPTANAATAPAVTLTATCYSLTMKPADPARPTYVSYADQTAAKARSYGLTAAVGQGGRSVLVCGRAATIVYGFRGDAVVESMALTTATSVVSGRFVLTMAPIPPGVYYIQAPFMTTAQTARAYGLTVVSADGDAVVVEGNAATVYGLFGGGRNNVAAITRA